jgi:PAS domain S-box-containing protein
MEASMTTAGDPNRTVTGVDEVLITAELARRPSRPPDYATENRALTTLAEEMATNPRGVLQRCAELVLELCRADSAGISLLEPGAEGSLFRWQVVVGGLASHVGAGLPLEASPWRTVSERNSVLLFNEAERFFPALRDVKPRTYENLLAPWHSNGQPVGALWAIKHTPKGEFDAEAARLLYSLARFAAAAHRVVAALDEVRTGREELERQVEERTRPLSEAYDSVRASETRFRTALEIETVGVIYLDPEGQIIDANDAFLAMGGYSREDLEAGRLTWQGLTPPEWMEASERALAELKATGRTTPYEKEYFRKDSSRWWALFAAKRLPDGTVFEFVLDLTARKEAEDALRASEERFQYCARATRDIIWDIDLVADRVWWSDAMLRQLGYAPEDIGLDTAWCFAHMHPGTASGSCVA